MRTRGQTSRLWTLQLLMADGVPSEKNGSCVGNLLLSGPVAVQSEGAFLHRFQRSLAVPQDAFHGSFASGDRVVVSDQEGRFVGLATGFLCEVDRTSVSCSLDR